MPEEEYVLVPKTVSDEVVAKVIGSEGGPDFRVEDLSDYLSRVYEAMISASAVSAPKKAQHEPSEDTSKLE